MIRKSIKSSHYSTRKQRTAVIFCFKNSQTMKKSKLLLIHLIDSDLNSEILLLTFKQSVIGESTKEV